MKTKRRWLWWLGLAVLLAFLYLAFFGGSSGRPTISRETTYVDGPLRPDGYVDYVGALNERCRTGVTAENNSAVLFLKAMWPANIRPEHRGEYCRMLGMAPLPEKGDYYVTFDKYAERFRDAEKTPAEAGKSGPKIATEQQTQAMKRPWTKREFPILADWVSDNEKPLRLLGEAARRPRRYDPLLPAEGSVMEILLSAAYEHREAARALTARAMLRVGEGKVDEAWEDLLACHRLARLAAQGPTLVEALIGISLDRMAAAGDQGLLQHARLTPAQIARMREDLDRLPPMAKMADKLDVSERFMYLDFVGMLHRDGLDAYSGLSGVESRNWLKSAFIAAARRTLDCDVAMRLGNVWYDRAVEALHKPTRAERRTALAAVGHDLETLTGASRGWKSWGVAVLGGRRRISERIGETLLVQLLPAFSRANDAEDRGTMQLELTKLAFALAAYRADHGAYPAGLAELAPKYLKQIPKDCFAGESDLHYRPDGDGYVLYSVGPNGRDDGSKGEDDRKEGEDADDLAVRIGTAEPAK